jgi:hypothetical protein
MKKKRVRYRRGISVCPNNKVANTRPKEMDNKRTDLKFNK